jgi:hypothetical protein
MGSRFGGISCIGLALLAFLHICYERFFMTFLNLISIPKYLFCTKKQYGPATKLENQG